MNMKRLIIACTLVFSFSLCIVAQHMSFMGIPMGTHINTFKKSLLSKGFKTLQTNDAAPNIYCYNGGTFSGYRVTLNVQVTPRTKKVYSVYAVFTDFFYFKSGYNSIYGRGVSIKDITETFNSISKKLTQKYGECFPFTPDDPQFLKWNSWQSTGGDICLVIANYNDDPNCVKMYIEYSDESTRRLNNHEENDDL